MATTTRGLVAGSVFSDFLERADHLLREGYKIRRRDRRKLPRSAPTTKPNRSRLQRGSVFATTRPTAHTRRFQRARDPDSRNQDVHQSLRRVGRSCSTRSSDFIFATLVHCYLRRGPAFPHGQRSHDLLAFVVASWGRLRPAQLGQCATRLRLVATQSESSRTNLDLSRRSTRRTGDRVVQAAPQFTDTKRLVWLTCQSLYARGRSDISISRSGQIVC